MKKSFKGGLALFLAVLMVLTTGLYSADGFLRATDGTPSQSEEPQAVEEQNADATKANETTTIEVPKQDTAEDSTATDAAQNEQTPASAADQGNSVSASDSTDADKITTYDVVIEEPSENGGTVKVWTDGSDEEEVAFTDGSFIKSVDEGGVLNVEITAKEGYSVKTVTENDKNINADSVSGSVYTYKINVNENKKLTVSYNRESSGSNGSNESSTSNGSQDNSTANKDEESSDDSDDSDPLPLGGIAADIPANILSGIATPFAVPMILTAGAAVSMPAQTFTDIASNGVKVTVYAPEGALPEGTTMKVTAISKKEAKAIYADTVDDSEKVTDAIGVDITFFKDGQEIEPEKDVKVQMETPALEGADYGIAHMRNNGNVELITDSASATGATFKSDEFSIYVAGGTEEKENVISVTVNYLSSNNFKLKDSDVYYVEADTNGYCIFNDYELLEEIEGKTLDKDAVTVDNNVVYDKENGTISISVKLGEGVATEYEINAVYKATMAEYTVEYAFEKLDGSGYEVDTDKTETASGEVGNYTDTSSGSLKKDIPGFTAKEVEEQKITADGKTVVTVEYDRNTYRVIYNTNGGSYVKAKSGKHGETVTISTGSISSEFVCTKEEHTHTAVPAVDAGSKSNQNQTIGCYTSTWSWGSWSWSWTLSCGKEEHTHGEGCYDEVNTIDPTTSKNGYTFGGWYMDEACTKPAVLATINAADVEVYAKWIPGKANYTIVYQKQNIDGTYSYISSKTAAGTVGTTVTANGSATIMQGTDDVTKYYHVASTSSAVLASSGTVVYVKYDLNTYVLKFNLNDSNAKITMDGNTYSGSQYTITCKLGEDISAKWPTATNISGTSRTFYGWDREDYDSLFVSKRFEVTTDMIKNTSNNATTTYTAYWQSGTKVVLHYMLQNADDNDYTDAERYRQEAYEAKNSSGFSAKQIDGFKYTRKEIKTENNVKNYYFYYDRNTYNIDYYYGAAKLDTKSGIRFEKNINTGEYDFTPKRPAEVDSESTFDWYDNVEGVGDPYQFNTMPASNLVLYGVWKAPDKTVTLIYHNGQENGSIIVPKGGIATIPTPTRAGYIFSGWFIAGTDTEFDVNAPITDNVTIEARWEAKNFTSYTVKYIDEEGNNLLDPYTSEENVQVGSKKIIYAEPIEGYVPDKASVDVTFVAGTNEIVFTYSNLYGITYKIQYVDKDGNVVIPAGDNALKVTSSPQIVTADKAMLNNNGYKLVAGEKSKKHFTPSSNNDENIVSFTVELKYYSISYTNVAEAWAEKQVPTYTINDEVKIATPAPNDGLEPKEGYEFIGWDYNTKDAILGTDITVTPEHSHTETVISEGSHANIEFKACWAKIEAEDATYTYSGTGKSIATAKVVDKAGNEYSGYTVTYSLKKDGEYTAEIPTKTDAGTYPIYIKAEKTGYKTITKVVNLIINPAPLTITTPSTDKVYDGEPLTAAGSITGFVNGETATFVTTGSQTEVGSSNNTYSITWDKTAKETNYAISETIGTLTVTENTDEIVVTTTGGTFTYDGKPHGATVSVSTLPKGYTLDKAVSNDTATNVRDGIVTANCDKLIIKNAAGKDVTSKLNIKYVDGSIKINPATLTVTTPSDKKVYDGEALTKAGSITGFVKGETATFTTTGSQTIVGESTNTYSLTWDGTATASNYTISESLGTLKVTEYAEEITVTTTGGTFTYNGEAHGATVSVSTLPKGYTLETATSSATATHVAEGTVAATCDDLVIRNAQGVDVTSNLNIKYVNGSITITPATLTVTTSSDSKVYNGDPLTAAGSITGFVKEETATFKTTGTQTEVGSSKNTYSITWNGTAVESDYTISETIGTLKVTEYSGEITVTTTGGTFTYDGIAHEATVSVSTLPKGYTLETATSDDSATHVAEGTVTANCDTLVIRNAAGEDVTSKLNIKYVDGSITITPATLTVTTPSDTKVYDSEALTAAGSITGFVKEETATFETTGSQIEVGYSANTYSITWDGTAVESDYTISESIGTLTVTENTDEIVVTTTGGEFTYDGIAHGATVSVSTLPKGYTLETATSDDSATNVADGTVTANCDTLVIQNAAGEDVTSKLNIKYVNGSIKINPATLTVVTNGATKKYDDAALTADGSIKGFVNGESAVFTVTGSQKYVGSSDNTYNIDWDNDATTASKGNYTINESVGILEVTDVDADPVTKTHDSTKAYAPGDVIEFTIVVKNIYDENKTIEIQEQEGVTIKGSAKAENVRPGETATFTAEYTVTEADIINGTYTNTVTAKFSGVNNPFTKDDKVEEFVDPNGQLDVTKRTTSTPANGEKYALGEKIQYEITVKNVGNLTLTGVVVEDALTYDEWTVGTLAPGASKTYTAEYTVTEADVLNGKVVNNAAATGTSPVPGADPVPDTATKEDRTDEANGHLKVTKTTTSTPENGSSYALGEKITYAIKVTNDGNLTATNVVVTDALTGDEWTVGTLAPGETSELYTAEHTVTEADILVGEVANVATATGTTSDPEGTDVEKGKVVDPTEVAKPSLFIKKEAVDNPSAVKLGDTINYVITVTNNGNVTIKNVEVTDNLTGDKAEYKALKPGESQELKVSYKVTEQDILNGKVSNVATVTGEPPEGEPIEETSKKDVTTEDPKGHITVTKETTSKPENGKTYALGETIQYKITAKNDGNLTIKDVVVTDELTGDEWTVKKLAPGASETFTAEYTVKEKDIKAGSVLNEATAKGTSPDPETPEVPVKPGTIEDPTDPVNNSYTIEKNIVDAKDEYKVGETIEYQIRVANNGNVSVENIIVTDQLQNAAGTVTFTELNGAELNDDNTVTIANLKPGDETVLTCEYVVVRADAGTRIANTAIAGTKDTEEFPTDTTDPVPVKKMYTLTIHYVYANGDKAAEDVTGQYLAGEKYDTVRSPIINGYTPDIAFVRSGEGGMPARDVEITVTYTANPTPTPGNTTGGGDGNTPAPRGAAIQANADGGVDVVPVVDEKVPLAKQDLSDHACCILHFLLMLLAMIILICYTVDMKKRQKRIAELKDELETEQIKRSGLSH